MLLHERLAKLECYVTIYFNWHYKQTNSASTPSHWNENQYLVKPTFGKIHIFDIK